MKRVEVAVVGAGPAGIAAALASASIGAETVLIDEQPALGGHLRWTVSTVPDLAGDLAALSGMRLAERLAEQVVEASIEVMVGGIAWGLFEGNVLGIVQGDTASELEAASIVVASGSTDLMRAFPGSTMSGVMTGRAVQIFLNLHRVLPGERFAVIGSGLDALSVAGDIIAIGAELVVRVDDVDDLSVFGGSGVEEIRVGDRRFAVDAVAVCLGRQPDPALALQVPIELGYLAGAGHLPLRGPALETSVPRLFVAGEAAGIVTVAEAMAEGRLAGLSAAGAPGEMQASVREALDQLRSPERRAAVASLAYRHGEVGEGGH